MDLDELNIKLNKCKKQRESIDIHLAKRQKLIKYFSLRKEIQLNKLKQFWIGGMLSILSALSFLPVNPVISFFLLLVSAGSAAAACYKLHVCKKFNKTIKKIEENNVKFLAKMQQLLENEFELDKQIKNLSNDKNVSYSTNINNVNYEVKTNTDLTT